MKNVSLIAVLFVLLVACSKDEEGPVDCSVAGLFITLGTVVDATSCGTADGSIRTSAAGGEQPYTFSLNQLQPQADGSYQNLNAGVYTVTVTDANGCTASVENITLKALDFTFTTNIDDDNSCLGGSGVVTVNVSKGNPPYTYRLGDGPFGTNNSYEGLNAGAHTITVKDNIGCSVSLNVTVPRGPTGTSWATEVKPIIETYCARSGCHDGKRPDLRVYSNAKFYAGQIKSKTQDRSMPFEGPALTQQQIDLLACWVDDGAKEN